jgi:hypothetical protein
MNCQKFESVVSDLARSRMMEADVRAAALAHGEECERCLARLRDEETLTRGLQLLAAQTEAMTVPDAMELRLREAFRSRRVVPVATTASRSRYWLVAVAAVLLIAMSVVATWWRSDAPAQNLAKESTPKQIESPSGPPQPAPGPKQVDYQVKNQTPKRRAPVSIHRNTAPRNTRDTQLANHVTNEIATDFMPLGDLNAASFQDGGQIVRVKLRRSALVRFGFPVNMDRYNENVKADVLVGVDGLARAIRFVQ